MSDSQIPASHEPLPDSLRDRIAQMLFVRIGSNLPPVKTVEDDAARVHELLKQAPLGGLCLFNGRWPASSYTLQRFQEQSRWPLLVASDLERGAGQQLEGLTVFPHNMAFDHLGADGIRLAERVAEATGREGLAAGVHINFSPVADVNSDPRNPIIATRSFSTTPARSAELVQAYIRGLQSTGTLATAKHFPGHGNTHEDSHEGLPSVMSSRADLDACDLVPFRAAIEAGVACVMTAHVRYDHLDPSGEPATLSKPILTDLLRGEMGFEGLIISDSLLMQGVKSRHPDETSLAIAAIDAGIDVLLDVAEPLETLEGLCAAVESGRLSAQRIEESVRRIFIAKAKVLAARIPGAPGVFPQRDAAQLASEVASQALQWSGNSKSLLPLVPQKPTCAILLRPFETYLDRRQAVFEQELRQTYSNLTYFALGPDSTEEDYNLARSAAFASEQLLVAMVVKPAAWHRFGLLPPQSELVNKLTAARPTILACLGTPVALAEFDQAAATVCAYSDVAVSQRALVQSLLAEYA